MKTWYTAMMKWWEKVTHSLPEEQYPEWATKPQGTENNEHIRAISVNGMWMFWIIWACVALFSYAFFQLSTLLYLIITWCIISFALERFIQFWQRLWASRWFALFFAYFLLIIFMLSWVMVMIPFIVTQLSGLLDIVFSAIKDIQVQVQTNGLLSFIEHSHLPSFVKHRFLTQWTDAVRIWSAQSFLTEHVSQVVTFGSESIKSASSLAFSTVDGLINTLVQIILAMTIAVFFSLERQWVLVFFSQLTRNPSSTYRTLQRISVQLGLWLEGQLLLCIIIGCCVALWLRIIGFFGINLEHKFSLALIAWLTEFLPYIGPILWGIPALLVASLGFGRKWFLITGIMYRIIQTAENNLIVPTVMSKKLWVNPLVIFLCMLIGASLFGFLWILLAVPLAILVSMIVELHLPIQASKNE